MPWCGCRYGRETSVPSSLRSVWLCVCLFVCVYVLYCMYVCKYVICVFVSDRAKLKSQKCTSTNTFCVQIRRSNHFIWMWNQIRFYILQHTLISCYFGNRNSHLWISVYVSKGQNVFFLPDRMLSLSESETSFKGCHSGESHFSQKSAARRETGAHRCVQLASIQHSFRAECFSLSNILHHLSLVHYQRTQSW